jgi:hypothetical protein
VPSDLARTVGILDICIASTLNFIFLNRRGDDQILLHTSVVSRHQCLVRTQPQRMECCGGNVTLEGASDKHEPWNQVG